MTNPCFHCTDRHPVCHDTCERYKAWQEFHAAAATEAAQMSRPKVQPPQFIAVTADEYELTLGAFDTVKELAAWSGHKVFAIYQSMEHGRILRKGPAKGCKVLRYTDGHYTSGILKPKTQHK